MLRPASREDQELVSLELLEAMTEHRAVDLLQDVLAHFDNQVRTDADNMTVERGVVQLAQRQPIRDERLAFWMAVGKDMGGIQ